MANAPTREPGSVPGANGRRNGGTSRSQSTPTGTPPAVTNTVLHLPSSGDREARRRRVAEAAYYRAERRGFAPGGDLSDWLEAEKEIEHSDEPPEGR
jgi:hypothetical protein